MSYRLGVFVATIGIASLACSSSNSNSAPTDAQTQAKAPAEASVKELSVQEAAAMITRGQAVACDANGAATRQDYGVVPGAVLLSNYKKFDVAAELPPDKNKALIFYCSNTACTAAPTAATIALDAGYQRVHTMPAGIMGWVDAGQKTDKQPPG